MEFKGFVTIDFSSRTCDGFVYVLCWVADGSEVPFYVGETNSIWRRLHEYYCADVQGPTDFKVGKAVKHLCAKGFRIVVRYKPSTDRVGQQNAIISNLNLQGIKLLNDCPGYKWDIPEEKHAEERLKIQAFMDGLLTCGKISN